ncbi:hypothetical protein P261_01745 [Lachnospiraceae bacterium TWA4]|nr:hypothetical protein P261_01745 [Lachnospiraceae bacterium TWA4]
MVLLFLLEIRERLRTLYIEHGKIIKFLGKFALCLWTFLYISSVLNYNEKLSSILLIVGISLVCSCLPINLLPLLAGVFVLGELSSLSLEITLVVGLIFVVMLLIYSIFLPEYMYILVLVPLLFSIKVPYILPLMLGIIGNLGTIIPLMLGVFVRYLIVYIAGNATVLVDTNSIGRLEKYMLLINGIIGNSMMFAVIIAFALSMIAVMVISRLTVVYSSVISVSIGVVIELIILLGADILGGSFTRTITPLGVTFGCIISGILVLIYRTVIYTVDYRRIETVEFEDDDYYYYVKAVPKINVSKSDMQVKKIVRRKRGQTQDEMDESIEE